ncbi:MAG TPA: 5-oxoprolinase subunit PxpA [Gemmatimonadaceae bacterium]|nr:5-oxoprolinase subunit PxpA [Gemmatimonadaceae bacterium]
MNRVDLNCDMGESFGAWSIGDDGGVMPYVSSINVACGFHAGDPSVMRTTVTLAAMHDIAIGAHPGLPDLIGFGRREMAVGASEVYDMVVYQVGALQGIVKAVADVPLRHVKPHGALYNMAAVRDELADAIARAVRDVDASLALVGLSGSALLRAGTACGLRVASEVFADRNYMPDGSLVPRTRPDALVTDVDAAVARAVTMATRGSATAVDGTTIALAADTICIHGDGAHAATFARRIRAALTDAHIAVLPVGSTPLAD